MDKNRLLADLLAFGRRRLAGAGVPDASRDAALLLSDILDLEVARFPLDPKRSVDGPAESLYRQHLDRRSRREPLQYILGGVEFMGLPFRVDPRVLIPRPETERLVETVIEEMSGPRVEGKAAGGSPLVADLGTGSGCIAVSLASLDPGLEVWAYDLSEGALEVARENAIANRVAGRIRFIQADILDPGFSPGTGFAALVSNPPYVSPAEVPGLQEEVRDYEPRPAVVTPGSDAFVFYRRLGELAAASLEPGGLLAVEVGAGMAEEVARIFSESNLRLQRFVEDYGGHLRVVLARVVK